jgi:hypothetical protein
VVLVTELVFVAHSAMEWVPFGRLFESVGARPRQQGSIGAVPTELIISENQKA